MSKVLIKECADYQSCDAALEEIFATFPLDMKDKKVCIKVNSIGPGDPHKVAWVTDYRLLAAVIRKVETYGPREIVVGDSVGTGDPGKSESVWEATFLKKAAGKYFKNFNKYVTLREFEKPFKKTVGVLKDVVDADIYISLPKMKTHAVARMSGAIKNNWGVLAGAQKSWYHVMTVTTDVFAQALVESFKVRRPDLVIIDGVNAQEGYGPVSDEINHVGKLIAGTDAAAIDTVFADMIGYKFEEVPFLMECRAQGIGETDLSRIEVIGDTKIEKPYHLPEAPMTTSIFSRGAEMVGVDHFSELAAGRAVIDKVLCKNCEECKDGALCVKGCPTGALHMEGEDVVCDIYKCIACTACMEWCPCGALTLPPHPELMEKFNAYEDEKYAQYK